MTKLAYNSNNKITNTGVLYYGKSLYYQTLSGRLRENFIDLWYSKPLYGKVDTDFNFVGTPSTNLKMVNGGRGAEDVYALDFVADAFNAMSLYLQQLDFKKKIRKGSFFYPLKAHRGWEGVNSLYGTHLQGLYTHFLNSYALANNGKINREINNFDDYLPKFKDYLNLITNQASVPLTKSGFISKAGCPHQISGLVIEIADETDFSDDLNKYRNYFSDPQFHIFLDIAKKFGFYIDMNAPWRLVANLESPAWSQNQKLKTIVDSYFENGYSVENVFRRNFYKSYITEVESLKVLATQFYNSLIDERIILYGYEQSNRSNEIAKVCFNRNSIPGTYRARGIDVVRKYRTSMPLSLLESKYDNLFWLRMYMQLRIKELEIEFSRNQMKFELREIEQTYRASGYAAALVYIANRLRALLEKQVGKLISLKRNQQNLLTTGKTPDIIL